MNLSGWDSLEILERLRCFLIIGRNPQPDCLFCLAIFQFPLQLWVLYLFSKPGLGWHLASWPYHRPLPKTFTKYEKASHYPARRYVLNTLQPSGALIPFLKLEDDAPYEEPITKLETEFNTSTHPLGDDVIWCVYHIPPSHPFCPGTTVRRYLTSHDHIGFRFSTIVG